MRILVLTMLLQQKSYSLQQSNPVSHNIRAPKVIPPIHGFKISLTLELNDAFDIIPEHFPVDTMFNTKRNEVI
jgi:hypothetical protein